MTMSSHEEAPTSGDGLSSIYDPAERRRVALAMINEAQFGWHHVRAVIVPDVGFFTDSYDIFAINLAVSMLGVVYCRKLNNTPGRSHLLLISRSRLPRLAALTSASSSLVGWLTALVGSACTALN